MVAFAAGGDGSDVPATNPALHPGMAFGTGEHQTTQLCCEALKAALADDAARGCTVLDYGSGSGVLSFAALRFGAARAVGVEIDPRRWRHRCATPRRMTSVIASTRCCQTPKRRPRATSGTRSSSPTSWRGRSSLAPLIAARVAAGGTLLLSGIWGQSRPRVTEAYAARGFGSCESRATNEWTLLRCAREVESRF